MKTLGQLPALMALALALCGCSYTATRSLYIPMESDQQKNFMPHAQALIDNATQRGKLKDVFEREGLINKDRPLSILGNVKSLFFGVEQGEAPNVSEQYERARARLSVRISKDSPNIIVKFSNRNATAAANVADMVCQLVWNAELDAHRLLEEQADTARANLEVAKTYLADKQQEIQKLESAPEKDQTAQAKLAALRAEEKNLATARDDAAKIADAAAKHLEQWQAAHKEMRVMRNISPEPKH